MNTKHSFWNRLFAALLLAVMLVTQTTTAFAVEDSSESTEPSTVQAQDSDTGAEEAGEGTDTPEDESPSEGPETALQTVSSLEELLQANRRKPGALTLKRRRNTLICSLNGLSLLATRWGRFAGITEPFTSAFRPILPKRIGHRTRLPACGAKRVIPLKNGPNGANRWERMTLIPRGQR